MWIFLIFTLAMCHDIPSIPIPKITPFTNVNTFDTVNAEGLLLLNFWTSEWSGNNKNLPQIVNFDLINTFKGYDVYGFQFRNLGCLYYSSNLNMAIISFSGTMFDSEWTGDFDFRQQTPSYTKDSNILVQSTINIMYESLRHEFIKSFDTIKNDNTLLVVTGHSLGGSLAALCFLDVIENEIVKNRVLYSFAAPRTGNYNFANIINHETAVFRIVNTEDLPPTIPAAITGNLLYEHYKNMIYFTNNLGDTKSNHIIAYYNFVAGLNRVNIYL